MKTCIKCNTTKELIDFRKRKDSKDGHANTCKQCMKEYGKNHYEQNKKSYIDKSFRWRNNERQKFIEFLKTQSCVDCGESNPIVLEFDHKKDKKFDIAKKVGEITFENLMKEIQKCDVVCANCHRKRTAKTFNWLKNTPL